MKHLKHSYTHDYLSGDTTLVRNERRTLIVVILTAFMMVAEIIGGRITGSMALLADGWHMASHAGALFISLMAYRLAQSARMHRNFTFGAGKFIPLGGYTSAIILGMVALAMAWESIGRLLQPQPIKFDEAIIVAVIGLIVNIVSAFILGAGGHGHAHGHEHEHAHEHEHMEHEHAHDDHSPHDYNIRSAYIHVLADAVTSVCAIAALVLGLTVGLNWMDPVMGIAGSVLIAVWAVGLLRETGWELLDGHAKIIDHALIHALVETAGTKVADLHVWRVAPKAYACELVIVTDTRRGPDYYREIIMKQLPLHHVVVEERLDA